MSNTQPSVVIVRRQFPVLSVLLVLFIVFKIVGVWNVSWLWVLSPILFPLAFVLGLLVGAVVASILLDIAETIVTRRRRRRARRRLKSGALARSRWS